MKKILFLAAGLFASTAMVAQSYEASLGLGALSSGSLKLEGMYHFEDNQSFNLELRTINNSLESEDGTILASAGGFALSPEYIVYFNSRGDAYLVADNLDKDIKIGGQYSTELKAIFGTCLIFKMFFLPRILFSFKIWYLINCMMYP